MQNQNGYRNGEVKHSEGAELHISKSSVSGGYAKCGFRENKTVCDDERKIPVRKNWSQVLGLFSEKIILRVSVGATI